MAENNYLCSGGKKTLGGSSNILKYCLRHTTKIWLTTYFSIYYTFYFPTCCCISSETLIFATANGRETNPIRMQVQKGAL